MPASPHPPTPALRLGVAAAIVTLGVGAGFPASAAVPAGEANTTASQKPTNCSSAIAVSPDGEAATVTFADAVVDTEKPKRSDYAYKTCVNRVTFPAKAGHRLAVSKIDSRAYTHLAKDAYVGLFTNVTMGESWNWWSGNYFLDWVVGEKDDDVTFTHRIPTWRQQWGPCGKEATVTLTQSMWLDQSYSPHDSYSIFSLDSADLSTTSQAQTELSALWEPCGEEDTSDGYGSMWWW